MNAWLTPEPPAGYCACGGRATFWDGGNGAAICRACLQEITDLMALVLVRHSAHDAPEDGCVPCRNGMPR